MRALLLLFYAFCIHQEMPWEFIRYLRYVIKHSRAVIVVIMWMVRFSFLIDFLYLKSAHAHIVTRKKIINTSFSRENNKRIGHQHCELAHRKHFNRTNTLYPAGNNVITNDAIYLYK